MTILSILSRCQDVHIMVTVSSDHDFTLEIRNYTMDFVTVRLNTAMIENLL